ncbi:MAG: hypothetical protein IJF34_04610 [Clostridia bacterium]|nr:hypothetical protein [Clostridia bacterium]
MANPNKKRGCGCLPILLLLIAGGILLWKGWGPEKLSDLHKVVTDAPPSYTASSEAEVLEPIPVDYTPLRHYRSTLSPAEQTLYDTIADAIGSFAPSVSGIRDVNPDRLFAITGYVYYDHPEYFWFEGESNAETTTFADYQLTELSFTYTMSPAEAAEKQVAIAAVTQDYLQNMAGMTQRDMVEYVYHRLGTDTVYDLSRKDQSFCTVLLEHTGLCAGYARSMQYILSRAGLDTIYLSGIAHTGEAHSWNLVKVDGTWYHTDATWGDPLVEGVSLTDNANLTYAYLFLSTDEVLQNRSMDEPDLIPHCPDGSLGYYRRAGLLFSEVTPQLEAALTQAARSGEALTFQAADVASFASLQSVLREENGIMARIGQQVGREKNMTRYAYSWRVDEISRTLRVEFIFTP